jgi:hypothetical protein
MENAAQNRTGKCPTCNRPFRVRRKQTWKPGIGAVRKCNRVGFTAADVRMALYQCKYAQWKQQEGRCGYCSEPMDPKHAVWISSRWLDGTGLSKWALGRDLVFNQATDEFDAVPRSPDEILAEYAEGLGGHFLWHKRCRKKFGKMGAGIPTRGPAHTREYDNFLMTGVPHHEAVMQADEALRRRSRARMEEARAHKAAKRRMWLHEDAAGSPAPKTRRRKRPASVPEQVKVAAEGARQHRDALERLPDTPTPLALAYRDHLRAELKAAEARPMTELERAAYGGPVEDRLARSTEAWQS